MRIPGALDAAALSAAGARAGIWGAGAGAGRPRIPEATRRSRALLRLEDGAYAERGVFRRGERATSALLPGFAVEVDATFDAD